MIVSELIKLLEKQDPTSRVLINSFDVNNISRKIPIKKVTNTDTGLSLHPVTINGVKTKSFSMNGGDEKIILLS